ncbi:hypothetical protein [Rhizobium laguerreae]|uniref:hypothetical protein n=1 Tax=Rhizobium laguerreae TaxID=1076926 RepID=UPI0028AE5065|nr:hypothetical protein [Rhizobium laguerreae]
MSKFSLLVIASSTAAFLGSGGYTLLPREFYDPACDIKGNVSIGSGAKIYHVKGQEDYEATIIDPSMANAGFARKRMPVRLDGDELDDDGRGGGACSEWHSCHWPGGEKTLWIIDVLP